MIAWAVAGAALMIALLATLPLLAVGAFYLSCMLALGLIVAVERPPAAPGWAVT